VHDRAARERGNGDVARYVPYTGQSGVDAPGDHRNLDARAGAAIPGPFPGYAVYRWGRRDWLGGIRREIVRTLIDHFTLSLDALETAYAGGTKAHAELVWTAGLLGDSDWANELHPKPGAFNRLGREGELKAAYVFLASRAADFVTGQVINVDGGATIW